LIRDSDYENYDYRDFWQDDKRLYEDCSERLALRKLFKSLTFRGNTFIDLGCGYGRLFNEYRDFTNVIMVDYSLNNLINAKKLVSRFFHNDTEKMKNIFFVVADVKNLPFKDCTMDVSLTIRVIHHLSELEKYFQEVKRILSNDGIFLLEFANKRNLKNILRFFTGRISKSPFSAERFNVGETILNYHPAYIKSILKKAGFKIRRQISVSNFRLGWLKRHIKVKILIFFENLYQNLFSWTGTGPSIFLKTVCFSNEAGENLEKDRQNEKIFKINEIKKPIDLFVCPACMSGDLKYNKEVVSCRSCSKKFDIKDGIYDFRL
jgi:ubiquinone/menaquinone biosynthesis C-methylase UbiE